MTEKTDIQTIRENIDNGRTADYQDRERAVEDLRFIYVEEAQWPADVKAKREADGRPCLTINKMAAYVDSVTGEQRQNSPQIKIRPVDSDSDPAMAEIYSGLIRNIETVSQAEVAYDTALECASACGRGFWRIITEYEDDSFNQEIRIKRIRNPLSVSWDPSATEWDLSDAGWMSVSETISRAEFKAEYPNASIEDFDTDNADAAGDWNSETSVRIAEYFEKEPVTKTIHQLSTGQIIDEEPTELPEGVEIVRSREVKTYKITWRKISGSEVLEGPTEWAGKYIPIIPVWGKEIDIEGERITRGITRYSHDSQRMYNYWRSEATAAIGKQPKDPVYVTDKQIKDHENEWDEAATSNRSYVTYKADAASPPPFKLSPVTPQTGILAEMQTADDDMRATAGLYSSSQGDDKQDLSGKAIAALQRKGDVGTFAYIDNLCRGMTHTGRILIDLIPRIYDTSMIKRILGVDGTEQFVELNWPGLDPETGEPVLINDLSVGKFDVTVTTGPSFVTQRAEAVDSMIRFAEAFPTTAPLIPDLVAKNQDWPNGAGDEIEQRLKKILPPGIATPEEGEEQQPEQPPQPNPAEVLAVKEGELKNQGLELENQKKQMEIKTEMAQSEGALRKAEGAAIDNQIKHAKLQGGVI